MSFQTTEEIIRTANDWVTHFAPPDFIQNKWNLDALAAYLRLHFAGVVTASNLTFAEQALRAAGQLQLVAPQSKEEIQAEAIAEQEARWRRQHQEAINQKPRDFAGEARADADAKAKAKEQADAEKAIAFEIERYTCNHARLPGVIDYARTQQLRKDLAKIEVTKGGKRDAVLTLQAVRKVISNLPG